MEFLCDKAHSVKISTNPQASTGALQPAQRGSFHCDCGSVLQCNDDTKRLV